MRHSFDHEHSCAYYFSPLEDKMGMQFDVAQHVFENRRESVIFYDGCWYSRPDDRQLFGNTGGTQSIEMSKEYLACILAYFDATENRERFRLVDLVTRYRSDLGL